VNVELAAVAKSALIIASHGIPVFRTWTGKRWNEFGFHGIERVATSNAKVSDQPGPKQA
jgi:hypothetical protein